jgi:hypothetical protein
VAFAVALNGVPVGDEDDGLRPEERLLYARLAELAERMRDG